MNVLPLSRFLFWFAIFFLIALTLRPWVQDLLIGYQAEPRAVTPRGDLAGDEKTVIQIFEATSPSVVFITTTRQVLDLWTRNLMEVPRGTGSGFIWDARGHVVTNYHVIEGVQSAHVRLADQRTYAAAIVGASPEHDIAVLRIHVPVGLPQPVAVGTSGDLRVGQRALAIGNPFGLDYTLTTGVISALDRSIQAENGRTIHHLIQTDAAINPGNSGGPLIDSAGRLIGMNTAIFSPSGAFAGIGFAVPVDAINRIVPNLIAHGRYVRPSLGIMADDEISTRLLESTGLAGVVVLRVEAESAAARAGLEGTQVTADGEVIVGDVILAVGDRPVTRVGELIDVLETYSIGDGVDLVVFRRGEVRTIPVVLGSSGTPAARRPRHSSPPVGSVDQPREPPAHPLGVAATGLIALPTGAGSSASSTILAGVVRSLSQSSGGGL